MSHTIRGKDVVNRTGGVDTYDGRVLYGIDAESYMKIQSKEDPEYEREVGEWIEGVIGEKLMDLGDLHGSLKDGTVLCKLLNKLRPGTIPKLNIPKPGQKLHPLMERANIGLFLKASEKFQIPSADMFSTTDLYGKANMPQVLQHMSALSRQSSAIGLSKQVIGPRLSARPSKIWEDVITEARLIQTEELCDDQLEQQLRVAKRKLHEADLQAKRALISRDSVRKDLDMNALEKRQLQTEVEKLQDMLRAVRTSERTQKRQLSQLKEREEEANEKLKMVADTMKSITDLKGEVHRLTKVKNKYKYFLVFLIISLGLLYFYNTTVTNEMQQQVIDFTWYYGDNFVNGVSYYTQAFATGSLEYGMAFLDTATYYGKAFTNGAIDYGHTFTHWFIDVSQRSTQQLVAMIANLF